MRKTTGPPLKGVMGRWAIFRDKSNGLRVQGVLTEFGGQVFEQHRRTLQTMYQDAFGRAPVLVSDSDTIEFITRGVVNTRKHLRAQARLEKKHNG